MAGFPQLGDSFANEVELRLAVWTAGVPAMVRMVVGRSEPALSEYLCNALGYGPGKCSFRVRGQLRSDDRRWVITERHMKHSHAFTENQHQRCRVAAELALKKLQDTPRVSAEEGSPPSNHSSTSEDDQEKEDEAEEAEPSTKVKKRSRMAMDIYPNAATARSEIDRLIQKTPGLLPMPTPAMLFPDSRSLLVHLHAAARQRGFSVYRISPAQDTTEIKLSCNKGHSQSNHRPLCPARYLAVQGSQGWRMVAGTVTEHTHETDASRDRNNRGEKRRVEPKAGPSALASATTLGKRIREHAGAPLASSGNSDHAQRRSAPPTPSAKTSPNHFSRPSPSQRPPSRPVSSTTTPSSPASRADMTFLPTLALFLSSLHPRLASLAPILIEQARLDSVQRLVLLLTLTQAVDTLDKVLKDLPSILLLDRHLLKKELLKRRDSGWAPNGRRRESGTPLARHVVEGQARAVSFAEKVKSEV